MAITNFGLLQGRRGKPDRIRWAAFHFFGDKVETEALPEACACARNVLAGPAYFEWRRGAAEAALLEHLLGESAASIPDSLLNAAPFAPTRRDPLRELLDRVRSVAVYPLANTRLGRGDYGHVWILDDGAAVHLHSAGNTKWAGNSFQLSERLALRAADPEHPQRQDLLKKLGRYWIATGGVDDRDQIIAVNRDKLHVKWKLGTHRDWLLPQGNGGDVPTHKPFSGAYRTPWSLDIAERQLTGQQFESVPAPVPFMDSCPLLFSFVSKAIFPVIELILRSSPKKLVLLKSKNAYESAYPAKILEYLLPELRQRGYVGDWHFVAMNDHQLPQMEDDISKAVREHGSREDNLLFHATLGTKPWFLMAAMQARADYRIQLAYMQRATNRNASRFQCYFWEGPTLCVDETWGGHDPLPDRVNPKILEKHHCYQVDGVPEYDLGWPEELPLSKKKWPNEEWPEQVDSTAAKAAETIGKELLADKGER